MGYRVTVYVQFVCQVLAHNLAVDVHTVANLFVRSWLSKAVKGTGTGTSLHSMRACFPRVILHHPPVM